ncbi:hypothetical protein EG329_012212 [Mollisiaceae sp. DMI_Dod_QoI]|nr:hypothetical protein EG329_012212 [Helotiales sp. DMI_Dod_QoI]
MEERSPKQEQQEIELPYRSKRLRSYCFDDIVEALSRPSSTAKRRDITKIQPLSPKKPRIEEVEEIEIEIDDGSSETSEASTVNEARDVSNSMSLTEETIAKADDPPKVNSATMPNRIFYPYPHIDTESEEQWEKSMLCEKRRTIIRVNKDGEDEMIEARTSTACYVDTAKKIIRRYIYSQYSQAPYTGSLEADIELASDLNLADFLNICRPMISDPVASLANLLRGELVEERSETFRCLATHPYYLSQKSKSLRVTAIKQELVRLFDRRFTFNVAAVYGLQAPMLRGHLLRLGDDYVLREEDGVNTGGADHEKLDEENEAVWNSYIRTGQTANPTNLWMSYKWDRIEWEFFSYKSRGQAEPSENASEENENGGKIVLGREGSEPREITKTGGKSYHFVDMNKVLEQTYALRSQD